MEILPGYERKPNHWILLSFLLLAIVVFGSLRAFGGLHGLEVYTKDLFPVLDPAWRVYQHQHPYIDFYSPLGPFTYLPAALGLMLAHAAPEGVVYGQVALGVVAACWAFAMARVRIRFALAVLLAVYVLLLTIAPFDYGRFFYTLSPAMTYNRTGYALLTILVIEVVAVPSSRTGSGWWGGLSTGTILAISLFLKVTYFFGGAFLVVALLGCRPQTRGRFAGFGLGFLGVCLAVCAYVRFDITAIFRDFRLMASAKHIGAGRLVYTAVQMFSVEAVAGVLFALFGATILSSEGHRRQSRRFALVMASVLLTGAFLLFSNFQERGLPLNFAAALVLADELFLGFRNQPGLKGRLRVLVMLWAVLLAAEPMAAEVAAITYGAWQRHAGSAVALRAPGLVGISTTETDYASFVDEGLVLARQHRRPADRFVSLDFSDFFSYGLRAEPGTGGAGCLHYRTTFNDGAFVKPERLFGTAGRGHGADRIFRHTFPRARLADLRSVLRESLSPGGPIHPVAILPAQPVTNRATP